MPGQDLDNYILHALKSNFDESKTHNNDDMRVCYLVQELQKQNALVSDMTHERLQS